MYSLKYLVRNLQHPVECSESYGKEGFDLGNQYSCLEMSKGYLNSVDRKDSLHAR